MKNKLRLTLAQLLKSLLMCTVLVKNKLKEKTFLKFTLFTFKEVKRAIDLYYFI